MRSIVAVLLIAGITLSGADVCSAASHRSIYAGTYAIRICRGHCSDTHARPYLVGNLVLFDRGLRDVNGHPLWVTMERHPANGCVALKRIIGQSGIYSGFPEKNYVVWRPSQSDNAIEFELFRSPDAGYSVMLKLTPKGLGGSGMFWGGVVGTRTGAPLPSERVIAERVGEPDIKFCERSKQ